MSIDRTLQLAIQKAELIERIAYERQVLRKEWAHYKTRFNLVDRISSLLTHPSGLIMFGVVLILIPRRKLWTWASRAWLMWRIIRVIRKHGKEFD